MDVIFRDLDNEYVPLHTTGAQEIERIFNLNILNTPEIRSVYDEIYKFCC
jgi:hypothetical protein